MLAIKLSYLLCIFIPLAIYSSWRHKQYLYYKCGKMQSCAESSQQSILSEAYENVSEPQPP